jgi:hypothetical protein
LSLAHLEQKFPNLAAEGYTKTSDASWTYNCHAHALNDQNRWWQPNKVMGFKTYWPKGAPDQNTVRSHELALGINGYRPCNTDAPEDGFEKIALYVDANGRPTHWARQQASGVWTSKLSQEEDIDHTTLKAIEDSHYGKARYFFKRPLKAKPPDAPIPK